MADLNGQDPRPMPARNVGVGMGVGIALGVALGAAIGNIGLGMAVGILVGGASVALARLRQKKSQ